MELYLMCLVVGFALGYGVREAMSRYRRARARREKEMMDHEFSINGATVGKRQPLISADSNFGRGGDGTDGFARLIPHLISRDSGTYKF
jgi:hypothetical protein